MEFKEILKKTWNFLWHSNSIWSWLANIVLAFIIIKFLLYPGMGLILGTNYPIVAVVSRSMEHDSSFDNWWASSAVCNGAGCTQEQFYSRFNITKTDFLNYKFKNGFNKGDIIFLKGTNEKKLKKGDVLVFKSKRPDPIIHRIVNKQKQNNDYYFQTKGDHNLKSISVFDLNEIRISSEQIIGKAVFRIPYLGWVKIIFVGFIKLFVR